MMTAPDLARLNYGILKAHQDRVIDDAFAPMDAELARMAQDIADLEAATLYAEREAGDGLE